MAQHIPASAAPQHFHEFRELVLRSPALQERLDAEDDMRSFVSVVVALGAEHGYVFTHADVESAVSESRRVWIERWVI